MKIKKDYETILVISFGFALLYFWLNDEYLLYVSLGVLTLGLGSGWMRKYMVQGWYGLAMILGAINGRILLTIVFYGILTPIALLRKVLTKQPKPYSSSSFFKDRPHTYESNDFENPW